MKLFLDRHRTLLPRIDVIYLLTRILTLAGLVWFAVNGDFLSRYPIFFWTILVTFIAHLGVFYAAIRDRFDLKLAYLTAIIYDIIFVPFFLSIAGGFDSSAFLLFFLTISISSYVLTFWFATTVVGCVSIVYLIQVIPDLTFDQVFDLGMRIVFFWIFYLAISYASEYMRKSEHRLMKVFDTLNMRTAELERSQAQLEVIYENTRTLASLLDVEGIVKEVIRIMAQTLGYQHSAIVQQDKWGHYYYRARSESGHPSFQFRAIPETDSELIGRVSLMAEPIRLKSVSDRTDYVPLCKQAESAMLVPMVAHGQTKGVLIAESIAHDFYTDRDVQQLMSVARSAALAVENAELHRRTEELTIIDELTEAYNYRYFVHVLEEEKKRALRYELPLSIIMVDIDWFKKINDSYGHEAGNKVLRTLSHIIKQCIRDVDIFTRYGGEEFAIILPQTPLSEASRIGERIRSQVEKTIIEVDELKRLKITVSVGVSAYPENGKSHEELVSLADQALYRAKDSGKNLVCSI
jgi:diguanylate cyclase (GGDEF)-like protein